MKRFVVLFLVLVLFIPVALSESNDVADVSWWDGNKVQTKKLPLQVNDKYIYAELPDGTIAIVYYFGNEKTADIAISFPGKTISSINDNAFNYSGDVTGMPHGYKINDTIYKYKAGQKLSQIIIPDTVQYLGSGCIDGSTWNHYISYNLPEQIKYVGAYGISDLQISEIPLFHDVVFAEGTQFDEINCATLTFEQGYKSIPAHWCAFFKGKRIVVPEGVEKIEKWAFANMGGSCVEIQLPQTLKRIEDMAFAGTGVNKKNPELTVVLPDTLQYIGKDVFCRTNIKSLTIPSNLKHIDDTAFAECPLANVTFSEGTTSITTKAFSDRDKLATLNLPTTLITIGERCFLRSGLTKLVIPANVTTIGEAAFKNSEKLKDITLPASLTSIADDAFDGCDPKAVFTVFTGTYAEQWANEHGYKTKVLVPVTEITLNEESATINKGKSLTLKATVGPKEATSKKVEWISTDPNVATVKDGKVQAKSCGSCNIICRAADGSGVQAVCHVSVIQMVTSLQAKPQKLTIPYGGTGEVEVTLKPEDATNKTLAWTSSDVSICVVDENGKITAVGAGDCEIVCATTDGSNKSAKIKIHVPIFDVTEVDFTVTEKEGSLIPVDLHGVSVANITHKSSSDKYFLYYFDTEGLHIFPIAEGTAKITLTSKLNKQDKTVYNVTVAKSALYDTANGEVAPLNVIVTLDKSEMNRGESYTMKYHIIGGVPPYKINNALVDRTSYLGPPEGSTYSSSFTGLSGVSGTKQFKANDYAALYERITINVVDSAGQACTGTSNTIRFNTLQITTDEILFASPKDSSITVHYHIEGGSGKYKLNADWNVYWNSGQLNTFYTEKTNSSSEGEFTFTPPPDCAAVYLTIQAVDEKNSKNNLWFSTP